MSQSEPMAVLALLGFFDGLFKTKVAQWHRTQTASSSFARLSVHVETGPPPVSRLILETKHSSDHGRGKLIRAGSDALASVAGPKVPSNFDGDRNATAVVRQNVSKGTRKGETDVPRIWNYSPSHLCLRETAGSPPSEMLRASSATSLRPQQLLVDTCRALSAIS